MILELTTELPNSNTQISHLASWLQSFSQGEHFAQEEEVARSLNCQKIYLLNGMNYDKVC